MTESSTPTTTLKIRIRFDGAPPPVEPARNVARFNQLRVTWMLGAVVLLLIAVFAIRGIMKNDVPEPPFAPVTEVAALPTPISVPLPIVEISTPALPPTNRVIRAALTSSPRQHPPVQELVGELPVADVTKRFYFFTEVHNVASRRFQHRWEYRGKTVAKIPFSPKGKNWTGSSSKQIPTHMQGAWRVVLVDDRNAELSSVAFTYGKELTAQN